MRNFSKVTLALAGLASLSACSSIIEGRSQEITVNTSPAAASCTFVRNNVTIGTIDPTPGSVLIEKTKYDMVIKCDKDGYDEATYFNKSDVDAWTFGNIVFGGLIGWVIDSGTGSDNKYDSPVNITLPLARSDEASTKPKHHHHVKAAVSTDTSGGEAKPDAAAQDNGAASSPDFPSNDHR